MSRKDRPPLADRIARAADAALAAQGHVSPIDVFEGIGWLYPTAKEWRQGRIECIEEVMQVDPARIADAIHMLRSWAIETELLRSEIDYVARTPQRQTLRFTRSGNAEVERLFRTHWISPTLSERQRERLVEKASRPPELVVVMPLNQDWACHRCGTGDGWLVMENAGPACLRCVGLDDLAFLGAGDALLTRRARAKSARQAVVVRFSRTRKRYERQGLLVEPQALADARRELGRPEGEP
jgi:hypothetical protein